jgi:hypothetical protein
MLYNNTTGYYNVALGGEALKQQQDNNVAIGAKALRSNLSGSNNVL